MAVFFTLLAHNLKEHKTIENQNAKLAILTLKPTDAKAGSTELPTIPFTTGRLSLAFKAHENPMSRSTSSAAISKSSSVSEKSPSSSSCIHRLYVGPSPTNSCSGSFWLSESLLVRFMMPCIEFGCATYKHH